MINCLRKSIRNRQSPSKKFISEHKTNFGWEVTYIQVLKRLFMCIKVSTSNHTKRRQPTEQILLQEHHLKQKLQMVLMYKVISDISRVRIYFRTRKMSLNRKVIMLREISCLQLTQQRSGLLSLAMHLIQSPDVVQDSKIRQILPSGRQKGKLLVLWHI